MNNNRSLAKEEKELQAKIEGLKTQVQNHNAAAQVAQRKALTLRNELAIETQRLLAERQEQFIEQQQTAEIALKATLRSRDEVFEQERITGDKISEAAVELNNVKQRIIERQKDLDNLDETVTLTEIKKGEIVRLIEEVSTLHSNELGLRNEITTLTELLETKKTNNMLLDSQKVKLEQDLVDVTRTTDEHIIQREKKIAQLDASIYQKRSELKSFDGEMELVRGDLANRQLQLDARDKNVRIRELKVAQDEQKIRANADLLNL